MCVRSAVSLGRRRSSVSGGGARELLETGRRRRSASSSLEATSGRSGRRAGLGGGLWRQRMRSGALGGAKSAAATRSLTAPAGARQPLRLLQATHAFQSSLSSNVYAVSHGIRSPKARVAGSSSTRLFAPSSNITAREHPSQRACVRPSVIGAAWKLHAHREEPKAGRARRAPTQTSEAATRRRRDDSEQTTYKQEG